jgi:hypothetical protein
MKIGRLDKHQKLRRGAEQGDHSRRMADKLPRVFPQVEQQGPKEPE